MPANIFNLYVDFSTPKGNRRKLKLLRWMVGMLRMGSPLPNILESLADISADYRGWLLKMANYVREGLPLSDALKKDFIYLPKIFKVFIKTGETYNILPQALTIASELRSSQWPPEQKTRVKLFLSYFLMIGFFLVFVYGIFVVPVFKDMFSSLNAPLPYLTQVIIGIYDFLLKHGLPVYILISIALVIFKGNKYFRGYIYRYFMFVPVIGKIIRLSWQWKICYGLGNLLKEGVPLDKALGTLGRGLRNPFLAKAEKRTSMFLEQGMDPLEILKKEAILSKDINWALSFIDPNKGISMTLIKAGERYRELLGIKLARFVSICNILFLFILIIIVAFIVISMYLPIFMMASPVV